MPPLRWREIVRGPRHISVAVCHGGGCAIWSAFRGFRWCLWVFASEMFVTSPSFGFSAESSVVFVRFRGMWESIKIFEVDFGLILEFDWICFTFDFLSGVSGSVGRIDRKSWTAIDSFGEKMWLCYIFWRGIVFNEIFSQFEFCLIIYNWLMWWYYKNCNLSSLCLTSVLFIHVLLWYFLYYHELYKTVILWPYDSVFIIIILQIAIWTILLSFIFKKNQLILIVS